MQTDTLKLIKNLNDMAGSSSPMDQKIVALTFDDGPNPHATPQILNILKMLNVKATFFLIGKWVEKYPEIAKRIVTEGHIVGGHTYSHGGEDGKESWGDFKKGIEKIKEATGVDVKYVRVPQFDYDAVDVVGDQTVSRIYELAEGALSEKVKQAQLAIVDCSINPNDWNFAVPSFVIKEFVLFRLHPGAIICLHDGSEDEDEMETRPERTIHMLPKLIEEMKEGGWEFTAL